MVGVVRVVGMISFCDGLVGLSLVRAKFGLGGGGGGGGGQNWIRLWYVMIADLVVYNLGFAGFGRSIILISVV